MATKKSVKKTTKLTTVEISVSNMAKIIEYLHDICGITWKKIAYTFGLTENTLRTIRKNAKK